MKNVLALLILTCFSMSSYAFDQTHDKWTEVLKKYQNAQGLVNYKKLKSDIAHDKMNPFNLYLTELQSVPHTDYEKWSKDEKKAFLINAYNALTFKLIVDNYPVASIKKIGGFFTKPWSIEFFSLLDGKIKKLDPIEQDWLRSKFKDFRIHAAVNCASISCPPLRHEAFVANRLDAQLDDQMKTWLKDRTRNQIDVKLKLVKISKIFDWYNKDFVDWGGGPLNVIAKYSTPPIPHETVDQIKVEYLDYNWELNETK